MNVEGFAQQGFVYITCTCQHIIIPPLILLRASASCSQGTESSSAPMMRVMRMTPRRLHPGGKNGVSTVHAVQRCQRFKQSFDVKKFQHASYRHSLDGMTLASDVSG